jgi:BlaI family transcriptional regulator, penicillinase repressor
MGGRKNERLTPLELEIMNVLWETGPANVQTVQQGIGRELAYTTVQTMLSILHRKGKVQRSLRDRAHFYEPMISRHLVISNSIRDIVDRLFAGSTESFVMSLVETKYLTSEKLEQLKELIDQDCKNGGLDPDSIKN